MPTPKTDWCLGLTIKSIIRSERHKLKFSKKKSWGNIWTSSPIYIQTVNKHMKSCPILYAIITTLFCLNWFFNQFGKQPFQLQWLPRYNHLWDSLIKSSALLNIWNGAGRRAQQWPDPRVLTTWGKITLQQATSYSWIALHRYRHSAMHPTTAKEMWASQNGDGIPLKAALVALHSKIIHPSRLLHTY